MKIELVQQFATDADTFWKTFFDEEYNEALFRDGIKAKERILLSSDETDERIERRVRVTPDEDVPAAVQKLIGGDTTYIEHTTHRKGSNEAHVTVEMQADRLKSKFSFTSVIRTEPDGTGIKRTLAGELKVKIPLMGGTIEKHVAEGLRRNDVKAAEFMKNWLTSHS